MSDQPPLLEAYLNGELDNQGFADFNKWLREDPEQLRQWAIASFLACELTEALSEQDASATDLKVTDRPSAAQQGARDAEVLTLLAQLEESADAETVTLVGELPDDHGNDPGSLSAHDLAVVGGYVLRKVLTCKPVIYTGLGTAAAAILLLALILINPFAGDATDPIVSIPDDQIPSNVSPFASAPIVATITDERGAVWDRRPGEDLYTGRRFTLTQGFAEITTHDGAVAILEGPATFEALGKNSIYLHSGKLFGVCETASSKGFLVQTPQADIIDLGTRFGVGVDERGESLVQVFDGIVTAKANRSIDSPADARDLAAGQALVIDQEGQAIEVEGETVHAFARLVEQADGMTKLTGDVRWASSATYVGKNDTAWPVIGDARVFQEAHGVTLADTLHLSRTSLDASVEPSPVEPGTTIRTYILLFNPGGPRPSVAQGAVTFDGDVLGVVIGDRWNESLGVLDDAGATRLFDANQKYGTIEFEFDKIELISDGRTLAFKLQAGQACDAIRIVVRESDEKAQPND